MEGSWFWNNWFELLQTAGLIGSLLFTAYTIRQDREDRKIDNLIAIKSEHRELWKEFVDRKGLGRVRDLQVDLVNVPITTEEEIWVRNLILHLDTAHRAMKAGMFVTIEGNR